MDPNAITILLVIVSFVGWLVKASSGLVCCDFWVCHMYCVFCGDARPVAVFL